MGVRVSQVRPSNCFKRVEKNSFTFHFWHKSFILDDVKLTELSDNRFEWKNVTFGSQNILWRLLYIFMGSWLLPTHRTYTPAFWRRILNLWNGIRWRCGDVSGGRVGGDDGELDSWFSDWIQIAAGYRHLGTSAVYNLHNTRRQWRTSSFGVLRFGLKSKASSEHKIRFWANARINIGLKPFQDSTLDRGGSRGCGYGGRSRGSGDGSIPVGPGAEPLVGVRGQSCQKRRFRRLRLRSLTYFDYLTFDVVFNFARTWTFIKGEKMKIMNSGGGGIAHIATHGSATDFRGSVDFKLNEFGSLSAFTKLNVLI